MLASSSPHALAIGNPSFVNDVMLAMSCRETGAVLITGNTRDFARIASVRAFDFVPPWP